MFTRRRSAMLLAALLLLAAALLPSLHRLQHLEVAGAAATSHCAHEHGGGSTAFEPVAAADDDCGLCVLLRAGRDWHGNGLFAADEGAVLPVGRCRLPTAAAPRAVAAATVHARAPPQLLGC